MKNNIKSEITKELMECLINNYTTNNDIKTFCDEVIKKKQNEIMLNPKVYIAKTKDPKTDIYYLNCKLFLPIGINKTKEVKVYIGKMSDYPNGCQDVNAKKVGVEKMKEKLRGMLWVQN
jgi:hypothetical protein